MCCLQMSLLKQVRKALFFHGEQGIEKKVLCIPFVNQLLWQSGYTDFTFTIFSCHNVTYVRTPSVQ